MDEIVCECGMVGVARVYEGEELRAVCAECWVSHVDEEPVDSDVVEEEPMRAAA
jgi:hypothetical protein